MNKLVAALADSSNIANTTASLSRGFRSITSGVSNHNTALKVASAGLVIGTGAYMFPDAVITVTNAMMSAGACILDTAKTYAPSVFGPSVAAEEAAARFLPSKIMHYITSIAQYILKTGPSAAEQAAKARDFATQVGVGIGAVLVTLGIGTAASARFRCDPKFLTAHRIVSQLTPLIEKHIETEGLYRISESADPLKLFFEALKADANTVIPADINVHMLTGTLKMALRELTPPLLQCHFNPLLRAANAVFSPKSTEQKSAVQEAFKTLPEAKASCLKNLVDHLYKLSLNAAANKMDAKNLSTIFTPNLVEFTNFNDIPRFIALFAYLIEHPEVLQR